MNLHFATIGVLAALLFAAVPGCGNSSSSDAVAPEDDSIWLAASQGRTDTLRDAIALGADIDATFVAEGVPGSGGAPLHLAALTGQTETVDWLIGVGADLDVRADDEHGGTPLHWAAAFGQAEVAERLLDAGADVNAADKNGYTPLDATYAGLSTDAAALQRVRTVLTDRGGVNRDG